MRSTASASSPRAGVSVLGGIARSSIGAKWVMGVTGALFIGWLILHLGGNLQVFRGGETFNGYAAFLANEPALLWGQRAFLLGIVTLHVAAGLRLWRLNKAARPQGYQGYRYRKATWVTRAMPFTGILLLAFLVFHLGHFTLGWVLPENFGLTDANGNSDIFTNVVSSFQRPEVAGVYIGAMVLLGLHLSHGVWSALQTFGLYGRRWTPLTLRAGRVVAFAIAAAFAIIPLAILMGIFAG